MMNTSTERQPETARYLTNGITIPRTAHARLLLHHLDADPSFRAVLTEVLPDEEARLAYLNHLAWQARS